MSRSALDVKRSQAAAALRGVTPPSGRAGPQRRIGDVMVELGLVERDLVDAAIAQARKNGKTTGQTLLESGAVDASQLARAVAERYGLEHVDLDEFELDRGAATLIDTATARRLRAIPIAFLDEGTLLVATSDPANVLAFDDIAMMTRYDVRRAVASAEEIEAVITQLGGLDDLVEVEEEEESDSATVIELHSSAEEAPVVKLVHSILADAVQRGASDVHFEPRAGNMRVRFRVDGVVFDSTTVPRKLVPGVVSRIKIMAELDISERRMPQDGRVGLTVDGRYVDIRVATLPIVRGEAVVMRILDKDGLALDLDRLGMEARDRSRFERAIGRTHGAVLVTGPTGAGKSTTLYAGLMEVNTPDRSLITVEDPVEYELDGIKQVQVNSKTGLTFGAGLRSLIRSDPDVIMVGEVRDRETAQMAIESALTGHLVLSSLHTNDAPMAPTRLIEMGIEPFLVAAGLECVVAQRLVRRLCDCKRAVTIGAETVVQSGFDAEPVDIEGCEPVGCVRCAGTGYRGRLGLYEVMEISDEIRQLVLEKAPSEHLAAAARSQGMRRLRDDGLEKVRRGLTSVPEVLRVLGT